MIPGLVASGAGTVAAFDPTTITGLQAWYKPDGTLWQDTARTIPVTADADLVGAWDDASGLGHHAFLQAGDFRPVYKTNIVNGKPVLYYDGGANRRFRTTLTLGNDAVTTFVVTKVDVYTSYGMFLTWGGTGPGGWNLSQLDGTGKPEFVNVVGRAGATSPTPLVIGDWNVLVGRVTAGNAWSLWRNGTSEATGTDALTMTSSEDLRISGRSDGFALNGNIAEVLIYDTALSDADRDLVEAYLGTKYGITVA